jgi:hypothetical protein
MKDVSRFGICPKCHQQPVTTSVCSEPASPHGGSPAKSSMPASPDRLTASGARLFPVSPNFQSASPFIYAQPPISGHSKMPGMSLDNSCSANVNRCRPDRMDYLIVFQDQIQSIDLDGGERSNHKHEPGKHSSSSPNAADDAMEPGVRVQQFPHTMASSMQMTANRMESRDSQNSLPVIPSPALRTPLQKPIETQCLRFLEIFLSNLPFCI